MTEWALQLLGGFKLRRNAETYDLPGRKDRLLLALLALQNGRPASRDRLAGLLWADRAEEQSRGSLRQSLAALRNVFGPDADSLLLTSRESVALRPYKLRVDVNQFEEASSTGRLNDAADLYVGPLLDGLEAPTPEYGHWLLAERQRLEDIAASVVERFASSDAEGDGSLLAISLAKQLLVRDRLQEPLYQALMKLFARQDKRAEAAKVFNDCQAALKEELGIQPSDETIQLFERVVKNAPLHIENEVARSQSHASIAERPSIAVMPFHNLSNDPSLGILCEGLAEDITTGLGRFGMFLVIDRYSSAEVGKTVSDAREIGSRLNVDLVVQGSLQSSNNALRLTVKLVEAATRVQRWSRQLTFTTADILDAPDKITAAILPSINAKIETALIERSSRKPSLAAYEHLLLGIKHLRGYAPDDNKLAIEHFDKAVASDPHFPLAVAYRAFADIVSHGYDATPPAIMDEAVRKMRMALDIDPDEPRIWWLMGMAVSYQGDTEREEYCYRKCVDLNPSDANALTALAMVVAIKGDREAGLAMYKEAFRLNPYHPEWYWIDFGSLLYICEKYEQALEAYAHRQNPGVWVLCRAAACYAQLDRMAEASAVVEKILKINPQFRLSQQRTGSWGPEATALFRAGMLKAGLLQ